MNILGLPDISRSGEWNDSSSDSLEEFSFTQNNLIEKINEIFSVKCIPKFSTNRILFFNQIFKIENKDILEAELSDEEWGGADKEYILQICNLSFIRSHLKTILKKDSAIVNTFLEAIINCENQKKS